MSARFSRERKLLILSLSLAGNFFLLPFSCRGPFFRTSGPNRLLQGVASSRSPAPRRNHISLVMVSSLRTNGYQAVVIPAGRGVSVRSYALEEATWPIFSEKRSATTRFFSNCCSGRAIPVGPRCACTIVRLESDWSRNCDLLKPFREASISGFF